MRTIEEIKKAIAEYIGDSDGSSPYYTGYLDLLRLYKDLTAAQDAEIARLRAALNDCVDILAETDLYLLTQQAKVQAITYKKPIPPRPQAQEGSHE
jgi:hypothetical protein